MSDTHRETLLEKQAERHRARERHQKRNTQRERLISEKEIYGDTLVIRYRKRLRDERKFESINELKAQLEHDKFLINN